MAQGGPKPSFFYLERQALTRTPAIPAAPTQKSSNFAPGQNDPGVGSTNPGDGLVLGNNFAVTITVYANPGFVLSGAGSLKSWIYNPYQATWTRCPDLDVDLTSSETFNARTIPSFTIPSRNGGLVNWFASGVTVSGGSDILVRLDGFQSVLGMST